MEDDRLLLPVMNALLAFDCAGRAGSFSKAAERMGTSQPSVSRYISNLEDYLGTALFVRHNNRLELTEEGARLLRVVGLSLDSVRSVVAGFKQGQSPDVLSIGCTHGFAHLWIMPRYTSLQAAAGKSVRIVTSEPGYVFGAEEVDFSIRFGDAAVEGFSGTKLFDQTNVVLASPDFCLANDLAGPDPAVGNLAAAPLLHLDDGDQAWMSWREWFYERGVHYRPPPDTFFYNNYAFTLEAAVEGRGAALAWMGVTGPYLENGRLQEIGFPPLRTAKSYFLVQKPVAKQGAGHQKVVDWFLQEAAGCR